MADSKNASRESREVGFEVTEGCGNDTCYCTGYCKGKDVLPCDVQRDADEFWAYSKTASGGGASIKSSSGKSRESEDSSNLTITVAADVNDAITGFKALSRELRETTKAARELEQAYEDVEHTVNDISTQLDRDDRLLERIYSNLQSKHIVEIVGKKVGDATVPTVKELQAQTLMDSLRNEPNIPDRLRDELLAKISEDEAIIAELERKIGDLSEVPTKELHEELAKREEPLCDEICAEMYEHCSCMHDTDGIKAED